VEFEFVVEMNLVQIGTNEFFPQLIRLAANERHLQSRPYSNQKLGRRDQSPASSELFLFFTRRFSVRGFGFWGFLARKSRTNKCQHLYQMGA
jgi:hypothetical protein